MQDLTLVEFMVSKIFFTISRFFARLHVQFSLEKPDEQHVIWNHKKTLTVKILGMLFGGKAEPHFSGILGHREFHRYFEVFR